MNYGDWEPTFRPADIPLLFLQDALLEEYGSIEDAVGYPVNLPKMPFRRVKGEYLQLLTDVIYAFDGTDNELACFVKDTRNALLLPLGQQMLLWMRQWLPVAEDEARKRLRRRSVPRNREEWRDADLVAEVEAACGAGSLRAGAYWFRCPFHEERTPSLHVDRDKRLWHCFGCQKGGGVVEWRKQTERTQRG